MSTNRPTPRTSTSFEYFLYAAIIVETGLAAFVYKIIFGDPGLARLSRYFAIFYFAFLAWSIAQLNNLHRRRKLAQAEPAEEIPEHKAAVPAHTRPALGLTAIQLAIVVVVFVSAVATFSWALKLLR
jgi:hypothetical protein